MERTQKLDIPWFGLLFGLHALAFPSNFLEPIGYVDKVVAATVQDSADNKWPLPRGWGESL